MLGITESAEEPCCGDLDNTGVSKPVSLVNGGTGDDLVDSYSCTDCRPRSGMNGESDLDVGNNKEASASLVSLLRPCSSDDPSDKMQLALLSRLRTPYVLSSTAWCRGGDREVLILFIFFSVCRKNDVGALLRALVEGDS